MPDVKVIDYDHVANGTVCNGIISAADNGGDAEAAWTFDLNGRETTRTRTMPRESLAALWTVIEGSLHSHGVFSRCLVVDPTTLMDPEASHLIVAVVERAGMLETHMFHVPADEHGAEFAAWLDMLDIPAPVLPS